jgi:hypothetical protein
MKRVPRTSRQNNDNEALPLEIYLPLVTSLYKDGRTLLVGTIVVAGSIFVTYWKTGDRLFLYCAVAFILVACARALLIRAYALLSPTIKSTEAAKRWEARYVAEQQPPSRCSASGVLSHSRGTPIRSPWSSAFR